MPTEIIPRNPGREAFKNQLHHGHVGLGGRFFLFNWLTVELTPSRDYIFADKFEPTMRPSNVGRRDAKAARRSASW